MNEAWQQCTQPLREWSDLRIDDMVFAYRKAKVDCFHERVVSTSRLFAEYEMDLEQNLRRLLTRLGTAQARSDLLADRSMLGTQILVPKKLRVEDREPDEADEHKGKDGAFFSDKRRAFDYLLENKKLTGEFRVAGVLPVDLHVLSALWVNRIGHRFDAMLGKHAYGSRLRRFGDDGRPNQRRYHLRAVGSMPPYHQAYRSWRDDGMAAVRRELEAKQQVIGLTLDLSNYFHRIDPAFALDAAFFAALGFGTEEHPNLAAGDAELNQLMCGLLCAWSARSRDYIAMHASDVVNAGGVIVGGIPIGLTAARVLANVLLQPWDKLVFDSLAPIHYGRYVDDMFLVMRDPGSLRDGREVMDYIERRLPAETLTAYNGSRKVTLGPWQKATELVLQDSKNKVFFLEGKAGIDLMSVIQDEIRDLASERRLMPEAAGRMRMASAHVLAASNDVRERGDTLRRADGLSIRRMGWAIQLRWAETLTLDLPAKEWEKQRREFFEFADHHVLRPDRVLDHADYLPRLLGVAIACEDWARARRVIQQTKDALRRLEEASARGYAMRLNGYDVASGQPSVWTGVAHGFGHQIWEAVLRAWPCTVAPEGACPTEDADPRTRLLAVLLEEFPLVDIGIAVMSLSEAWLHVARLVPMLADCDLARSPYKELWRAGLLPDNARVAPIGCLEQSLGGVAGDPGAIQELLAQARSGLGPAAGQTRSGVPSTALQPFLFPTRPLSIREIAEWDPACCSTLGAGFSENSVQRWARMARAFRGIWTRQEPPDHRADFRAEEPPNSVVRVVTIGEESKLDTRVFCISSFETADAAWNGAGAGEPILTLDRYDQFARFVNSVLRYREPIDYLLLPELCVPRRWVASLVNRLLQKRISVIAGVEYARSPGSKIVRNEAVLALTDDRLGFASSILIWHPKSSPAPTEEHLLRHLHGVELAPRTPLPPYPVYRHRGVDFAVLVCSELQDIRFRSVFRGQVDCLMVLAWNKDLETFSALVESAALDTHAYVALVNNRRYGGGRVRAPAKEAHQRDLCRLHGGLEDYAVLVRIEIEKLRRFQSRAKSAPSDTDPFKPVPQGFEIAARRRGIPWL